MSFFESQLQNKLFDEWDRLTPQEREERRKAMRDVVRDAMLVSNKIFEDAYFQDWKWKSTAPEDVKFIEPGKFVEVPTKSEPLPGSDKPDKTLKVSHITDALKYVRYDTEYIMPRQPKRAQPSKSEPPRPLREIGDD